MLRGLCRFSLSRTSSSAILSICRGTSSSVKHFQIQNPPMSSPIQVQSSHLTPPPYQPGGFQLCEDSSPSEESILCIPEAVRGMTQLDRDKFRKTVSFPVIEVESRDLCKIRGKVRIEKYLVKNLLQIKNLMDADDAAHKLLVFDPDRVREGDGETRKEILDKIAEVLEKDKSPSWSTRSYDVSYDNWDMRRILRAVLPKQLDFSSFTQTGHIIHCNLRDELLPYKKVIAEILIDKVKQCKTVVNKLDGITNEYRNFELELIGGEDNYVAEVIEAGTRYRMDFSKVFWNSRLSHEHERVFKQFNSRSLVYDACAGVGPFALPAVKKVWDKRVLANDLNPDSVHWMKENCKINRIPDEKIEIHNMDAAAFIRGPVADSLEKEIVLSLRDPEMASSGAHIMMNLPAHAIHFLRAFRGMLSNRFLDLPAGDRPTQSPFPIVAYCYLFAKAHQDVPVKWYADEATKMVYKELHCPTALITLRHHVRTVSSRKEMFCIQIELPWHHLVADDKAELTSPTAKKPRMEGGVQEIVID